MEACQEAKNLLSPGAVEVGGIVTHSQPVDTLMPGSIFKPIFR